MKRKGFKDEAEYRIIAENNSEQSSTYPVNIDLGCIERITINPWLPKSIAESVIEAMNKVNHETSIDIGKSTLIDNTRWKRAGDEVIKRKKRSNIKTTLKKSV